jgi:hypothetical protein
MKRLALLLSLLAPWLVACDADQDDVESHSIPLTKVAFDREAGIGFGLTGRVLTISLPPYIPGQTPNRVSRPWIRATCGQGFTGGQGDTRQERTRRWPVARDRLDFRFRRDISRIARWCRLEDRAVGQVAFVKFRRRTLSADQRIERIGNDWARLYAARDPRHCDYEGQPLCERLACERVGNVPIENCTRPSPEFRSSFRDATVEDIAIKGREAAARFSNGEAIELGEDVSGLTHAGVWWWITKVGGNAGRGYFR